MDLERLNQLIDKSGLKKTHIAEQLGLSVQGLHNKLTGRSDWYRSEIVLLSEILEIDPDEKEAIFFTD